MSETPNWDEIFREAEERIQRRTIYESGLLREKVGLDALRDSEYNTPIFAKRLKEFREQVQDGDEIWTYSTGFGFLCGCAGYILIRDGEVVADLVTLIS